MCSTRRRIRGWRLIRRVGGRAGGRVARQAGMRVRQWAGSRLRPTLRALVAGMLFLPAYPPTRLPAQDRALAKVLDRRLDAAPFDRLLWGVAVLDEKGRLLYGRNAER